MARWYFHEDRTVYGNIYTRFYRTRTRLIANGKMSFSNEVALPSSMTFPPGTASIAVSYVGQRNLFNETRVVRSLARLSTTLMTGSGGDVTLSVGPPEPLEQLGYISRVDEYWMQQTRGLRAPWVGTTILAGSLDPPASRVPRRTV